VPAFYDAALASPALHVLEHVLYVSASLLLWVPILAVEPLPHAPSPVIRLLTVMAAMPAMILLGVALTTATSVAYPTYAASAGAYGTTALADQALAGQIMWFVGGMGMAAIALVAAWRAVLAEERRAVLAETVREERSP
jgi:cytochrome c oxidase assembly factor CtaG